VMKKSNNMSFISMTAIINKLHMLLIVSSSLLVFILPFSGCISSSNSDVSSGDTTITASVETVTEIPQSPVMKMKGAPAVTYISGSPTIPLYHGEIPNSLPSSTEETSTGKDTTLVYKNISLPTLSIYLPDPDASTGAAVIYCPGGGYSEVQYGGGIKLAKELIKHGIAVFILKYRLPNDSIMQDKSIGPLQDGQQAVKIIRQRAEQWGIDPDKIGIMGYSAGGHLASAVGTHFNNSYIPNEERISLRPDFVILISSVISMQSNFTHMGSRDNLLGENPGTDLIDLFSNELHITKDTPPTWLIHAKDDTIVSVENSIRMYEGLIENKIFAEMDLYPTGFHSLVWNMSSDEWMEPLYEWMTEIGILPSPQSDLQQTNVL
jgi:acetyl esterase/lipase